MMVQGIKYSIAFYSLRALTSRFRTLEALSGLSYSFLQDLGYRQTGSFSVWVRTLLVLGRALPSKNARTRMTPCASKMKVAASCPPTHPPTHKKKKKKLLIELFSKLLLSPLVTL